MTPTLLGIGSRCQEVGSKARRPSPARRPGHIERAQDAILDESPRGSPRNTAPEGAERLKAPVLKLGPAPSAFRGVARSPRLARVFERDYSLYRVLADRFVLVS